MSSYNLEFNKDESIIRYILVATLAELNNKLSYKIITSAEDKRIVDVPFYYSLVGSERFLYDKFLKDTDGGESAEGVYDVVPRGILEMDSMEIDSAALVNKFVRMEILKKEGQELKPYSYETMLIPIRVSCNATVVCSTNIEMLKLTESIIKTFYKNNAYYVDLGGYRVAANLVLPENLDSEKLFEFSFTDRKVHEITFPIEVTSFLPVFDENTEMFAGNVIQQFTSGMDEMKNAPGSGIQGNLDKTGN